MLIEGEKEEQLIYFALVRAFEMIMFDELDGGTAQRSLEHRGSEARGRRLPRIAVMTPLEK